MHHQHTIVKPYLSFRKLGFAEPCTRCNLVNLRTVVGFQQGFNGVQIAVAPRPEMQSANGVLNFYGACFARLHGDALAIKAGHLFSVHIKQLGIEGKRAGLGVVVANLRFGMNGSLVLVNVEIGSIDVGTSGAEMAIQGQGLLQLIGNMQEHVLGYAAIVGVEVAVVPLISTIVLA